MFARQSVEEILSDSPVRLYFSASDSGALKWPWRMNACHHAEQTYVDNSEHYILDSAFQRDDIGTEDVLDKAVDFGAEMVALVDIYGSKNKTVDKILSDMEIVDDHEFSGDILVPLQPPHGECYKSLEGVGDWYAIGGVMKAPPEEKIQAAQSVRDVSGDDIHLHGLGWGATDKVIRAIRDSPQLVDSIDSRGEFEKAMRRHIEQTWKAERHNSARAATISAHALGYMLEAVRRMNPEVTIDPQDTDSESASEADW